MLFCTPPCHRPVSSSARVLAAVEKNLRAFLDLKLPGSKLVVGERPQRKTLEREYPDTYFAGARFGPELSAAYAGADVFVFHSKTDTFGLVVLEALAAGLPVAAYNVTGPKDILGEADQPVGALNDNLQLAALDGLRAALPGQPGPHPDLRVIHRSRGSTLGKQGQGAEPLALLAYGSNPLIDDVTTRMAGAGEFQERI